MFSESNSLHINFVLEKNGYQDISLRYSKKTQKFALHLSSSKLLIRISRDSIGPAGLQVRLWERERRIDSLAFDTVTDCSRQFNQNPAASLQEVFCFVLSPSSSHLIILSKSSTWNLMTEVHHVLLTPAVFAVWGLANRDIMNYTRRDNDDCRGDLMDTAKYSSKTRLKLFSW
jgi:hypothetical protein